MRLSRPEIGVLIEIIFEWDRWMTIDDMESSMHPESINQVKPLFRKLYDEYWTERDGERVW